MAEEKVVAKRDQLGCSERHRDAKKWQRCFTRVLVKCLFVCMTSLLLAGEGPEAVSRRLPKVAPADVGMSSERLADIDSVVQQALEQKKMPGCVVAVGHGGKIAYLKAFGNRQVQPQVAAMTTDTVFDMASLTKPLATATSIMKLIETGQIRLQDRVAKYLPEFGQHGKERITVYHLLTHQGGLTPDNPLADYEAGPEAAWKRICELGLQTEPGTKFIYSDVGYIVLGELVRRVTGTRIDQFASEHIYTPLGMFETGYLPAPRSGNEQLLHSSERGIGCKARCMIHGPSG